MRPFGYLGGAPRPPRPLRRACHVAPAAWRLPRRARAASETLGRLPKHTRQAEKQQKHTKGQQKKRTTSVVGNIWQNMPKFPFVFHFFCFALFFGKLHKGTPHYTKNHKKMIFRLRPQTDSIRLVSSKLVLRGGSRPPGRPL